MGRYLSDGRRCAGGGCDLVSRGHDSYQVSGSVGNTVMYPDPHNDNLWTIAPDPPWGAGTAEASDDCSEIYFNIGGVLATWTRQ
jgi:hypothetical protein